MSKFWYWWDKNVIGRPFWSFMGKVYAFIFCCGIIGCVIGSLIIRSWTECIFGCLMATMFLFIFTNLGYSMINMEMSTKYWDKNWDSSRNPRKIG